MSNDSQENLIDALAEDFVTRYRLGERPALTEYVVRHPELAKEIRDLFPTLVMMEQARSQDGSVAGRHDGPGFFESGPAPVQLGDFRILREVGRGGMGIVYEAFQESLGRHVALKVLPAQVMLNPKHALRFQREARAAARLHHPNIVPVYGVGEVNAVSYYAMQFIQGLGLDQVAAEVRRLRHKKSLKSESAESLSEAPSDQVADSNHRLQPPGSEVELDQNSVASLAVSLVSGAFPVREASATVVRSGSQALPESTMITEAFRRAGTPNADVSHHSGTLSSRTSTSTATHSSRISSAIHESGRDYWNSVARIGVQVAEALQHAADEGVLHRDIKPANLLLDLKGNIWVTDFGLAKADDSDELTNPGDIVGTLRYLAPERLKGESTLRSDIYSLGATLYELLVLRPLFSGMNREQLLSVITDVDPVRPRLIDNTIPADLETIVLKAMSKDSLDRYATATELAEDLGRFLDDRPVRARRIRTVERFWRWCRRNRMIAGLVAVSGTLTVLLTAGVIIAGAIGRERDAAIANEERAERAEAEARRSLKRADTAEQESRMRAHLAQANVYRQSGYEGQRFNCLDELRLAAKLNPEGTLKDDLRDSAIAAMGLTDLKPVLKQQAHVLGSSCFDHRLKHFALINIHGNRKPGTTEPSDEKRGRGDFSLTVRTVQDNKVIFQQPGPDYDVFHAEMMFSPDDRYLLIHYCIVNGADRLVVWDLQTRELILLSQTLSTDISISATVSPNGRVLVFPFSSRELIVWDLPERRELRRIPLKELTSDVCFDPTGTRLAVNESESRAIVLLDAETGQETDRLMQSGAETVAPGLMTWSSDGQLLAVCGSDATLRVWNVPGRELTSVLRGHDKLVTRCEFANKGYLLLTYSWDKTSKLWNASTGECLLTSEHSLSAFSADDQHIAYGHLSNLEYGLCELSHDAHVQTLHDPACGNETIASELPGVYWARFSNDQHLLAVYGNRGVALWDVGNGQQLQRLSTGDCVGVLFHPDGSELVTTSTAGVYRWPVSSSETNSTVRLQIGPPERLAPLLITDGRDVCWLPDFRHLAVFDRRNRQVVILDPRLDPGATDAVILPSRYRNVSNIAASPDGRWLAGSGHHVSAIQIWDLQTNERTEISHGDGQADVSFGVSFSPDNRWLISTVSAESTATGHYFFETGTWKRIRFRNTSVPPGTPAFSEDSRLFTAIAAPYEIMIADSETGRTITQFRVSDKRVNPPLALLGQQNVLAVASGHDVVLWNLATISAALRELGLPWDESLQAGAALTEPRRSVEIIADHGDLPHDVEAAARRARGIALSDAAINLSDAGRFEESSTVFQEAIDLAPDDAIPLHDFARMLIARPDRNAAHTEQAVDLAQRAVDLEPQQASYWNTLGVAQYRQGEFRDSIESLERSEGLQPRQWFSTNAYFIAMAHWQLGNTDEARRWFGDAVRDHDAKGAGDEELAAFRFEAETLIRPK